MTRSHKKKATQVDDLIDNYGTGMLTAPPPSKYGAKGAKDSGKSKYGAQKSQKPRTVTGAPKVGPKAKAEVGLLVTGELDKAIEECRIQVAQIVKGCRDANRRFRDVEFDLENDQTRCLKGLNYDASDAAPPSVLRVTQIFEKPQFVVDGADAVDIIQGSLGDCWLLSGLATMSTSKGLIEKLCISRDEEVGVYGFVFFHGSRWVSVIIDDQLFWSLPKYEELSSSEQQLYRGDRDLYNKLSRHGGKGLYFARSGTEEETWVPLIEKAFAKLHGDYASLEGGFPSEAIEDLTGGVSMMYRTKDILHKDRFWKEELLHATKDRLFACSFNGLDTSRKNEPIFENPKVNGLIGSHAYSVLRAQECKGKRFVVIRNPWGASEWTGAWGDGSKEWQGEWLDVLKELDHVFGDDGEFVMEYCDFLDTFELIERTTIFDSRWVMSSYWLRVPPHGPNHPWTFGDLSFKFTLHKPSFTIIALSQLDDRYFRGLSGFTKWSIDFVVYKRGDKEITGVSYYANVLARSVTCELHLEAGEYIVFPRFDRYYSSPPVDILDSLRSDWNPRKLTRVLTEKSKARSIAVNLHAGDDDAYIPKSIERLIEEDVEKLNPKAVDDDDDDEDEEEEEEEENKDEPEKAEDDPEKEEGNPEKDGIGEPFEEPPPPGVDSDDDDLILGLRIYSKGGAVVSVTGEVTGEENDEVENAKEGKGKKE